MIRGLNENINGTMKLMKANAAAYEISAKQYEVTIIIIRKILNY